MNFDSSFAASSSLCSFNQSIRSLQQSFAPSSCLAVEVCFKQSFALPTNPPIPSGSPQASFAPSGSLGCGGCLFQLWLLSSPSSRQQPFATRLRSLRQSFAPSRTPGCGGNLSHLWLLTNPSLHQAILHSFDQFFASSGSPSLPQIPSGSLGCDGNMFQLWLLTRHSPHQAVLRSLDQSFAPSGSPSLPQAGFWFPSSGRIRVSRCD